MAHQSDESIFELFQGKQFRKLARFKQIGRLEPDRTPNEPVLAVIILIILTTSTGLIHFPPVPGAVRRPGDD